MSDDDNRPIPLARGKRLDENDVTDAQEIEKQQHEAEVKRRVRLQADDEPESRKCW